jgi:Heat shock protein
MKRILKVATLFVATAAFVFGMQSCSSVKSIDRVQLDGLWTLKSLEGEKVEDAFKGKTPDLKFDFEKKSISGNSGCNNFSGGFTLTEKNEFSAPALASTRMMCFDENKESQFLSALSSPALSVALNESGELIFSKNDTIVLQFVKGEMLKEGVTGVAVSGESLAGKWVLTSIADGDINALFNEKKPTMEIVADGKVFGNAGCNTYRTSYELADNTITFKPSAATMMACPSLEGEGKFLALLTTPLQVSIDSDKLVFKKEGNIVLEFIKDTENK